MEKNIFDLSGQIAVITGAGSGLGQSIAVGFSQYGANIVCADIDTKGMEETAESVKKEGRETLVVHCDVANQKDVDNLVARTIEKFGDID
ncbi:MAG: SDR family NAD(P)-dependent oxidoreductase, partial [Erysipelotrichaceae bacterium]|nr:SDR family NAD(P)-dependent oxidoreductase [Erysipelotrichaceae bacterium]